MTNRDQIVSTAVKFLKDAPQGIRYSELRRRLADALPNIPANTIAGVVWNLEIKQPSDICKPARGVYLHTKYKNETGTDIVEVSSTIPIKIKEEVFYKPVSREERLRTGV